MKIEIPSGITDKIDIFDFLIENKELHYSAKKQEMKKADSVSVNKSTESTEKALKAIANDVNKIEVTSVINTTKVMDSHSDVHIDGIWRKSLKENKSIKLLQEHVMKFDHVISDKVKATAENTTWKELGFKFKGETQALTFVSQIDKSRNEFMFDQYSKGFVDNHSVGMQYVKLNLAINSDDDTYKEEKAVWDKHIGDVLNVKDAENQGYFWAVTEAKVVEGSAVVQGSNTLTPTTSVEPKDNEPQTSTRKDEPSTDTRSNLKKHLLTT